MKMVLPSEGLNALGQSDSLGRGRDFADEEEAIFGGKDRSHSEAGGAGHASGRVDPEGGYPRTNLLPVEEGVLGAGVVFAMPSP
jgi:hypothetical protein